MDETRLVAQPCFCCSQPHHTRCPARPPPFGTCGARTLGLLIVGLFDAGFVCRRPKEEPSHGFNIFRQLEKAFSWGAPPGARAQPVPEEPALRGGDGEAGFGIGRQANPATEEEKLFVETAELSKQLAAITAQVPFRPG